MDNTIEVKILVIMRKCFQISSLVGEEADSSLALKWEVVAVNISLLEILEEDFNKDINHSLKLNPFSLKRMFLSFSNQISEDLNAELMYG